MNFQVNETVKFTFHSHRSSRGNRVVEPMHTRARVLELASKFATVELRTPMGLERRRVQYKTISKIEGG